MPRLPPLPPRFAAVRVLTTESTGPTVLARDRQLDRLVAIKLVDVIHASDPEAAARFEREAQAAASVSHPNVVDVFDYGSHAGVRYLVFRHIEGSTLRSYLDQRGRLDAGEATRVVGQILAGLGAIHAAGFVHRHLSPETIIVGDDGLLRITEFSFAAAPADCRPTMRALSLSAPAYLAPEQSFGNAACPATDLYAVGVILFEMLTGEPPFPLGASPVLAFARAAAPPPMADAAPGVAVPSALEAAVKRALDPNPDDRFRTSAEMAEAVLSSPVEQPDAVPVDPATPVVPERSVRRVSPTQPPRITGPAAWLDLAIPVLLAALIAAIIGGAARLRQDDGPPQASAQAVSTIARSTATPNRAHLAASVETPTPAPAAPTPTEGLHAILAATKLPDAAPSPTATKATKRERKSTSTGSAAIAMTFTMSDWRGGYAGNQTWYGRPWIAIYGAQSAYPRATLDFSLKNAPSGEATLTLDGLDDEWAGNVAISVTVNGVSVYEADSPFVSWNGQGRGENARWTAHAFEIPAGMLRAGDNQIVVANLEPVANFGTAPYVLLSDASLTVP